MKISWKLRESRLISLQILEPCPNPLELENVPVPGFTGFRSCFPERSRLGLSLTESVALHLLCIFLAVFIGPHLRTDFRDVVAVKVIRRESLTYRLPSIVYVSPVALRAPKQPKKNPETPAPKPARGEKTQGGNSPLRAATRTFELPPMRRAGESEQTILIPQLPPEAPAKPVDIRLPKVTFWSSSTVSRPRPPEKKFIQPGRDTTPAPPPALIAPPQLQIPNQEKNISDIQIASGVTPKQMPMLPRAPSTTMPVQMIAPPEITAASDSSLDVHPGEPASVVALNMNPAPPRDVVSIPRVNQVGKLPGIGEGSGSEAGTPAPSPGTASSSKEPGGSGKATSGSGNGTRGSGNGTSGSGKATIGSGNSTRGSSNGTSGSSNATRGSVNGTGGSAAGVAGADGKGAAGPPKSGPALPVPGRMVHPIDGVFDMVVVHSSPADGVSEDARLLTGKPVYTVYLRVGTPKEWVLRYCVPKSGTSRNSGMVIQMTPPSPLTAPYPRVTVTPPKPVLARAVRTVLHGFLSTNGFFRNLTTVNPEDAEFGARISSFLNEWEFRPASRDGKPIEVEVVLAIPAHEI